MNHIENLLNLIRENPTLPVVPMVDCEVVGDDGGRWMGAFGYADVGEYALYNERFYQDRDDFKEDYYDFNDDEICERFNYAPYINEVTVAMGRFTQEQLKENKLYERLVEEYLDKMADEYFVKAIIVNIDTL